MATTPNYGYTLPTVGGDTNSWGASLNQNWTDVDDDLNTVQAALTALTARVDAAEIAVENNKIKVGDLYLSTDASDPATKLGYGTWSAYAEGRALLGVGNNGDSDWTIAETGGSETHTLTTAEMPVHSHGVTDLGHAHTVPSNVDNLGGSPGILEVASDPATTYRIANSASTGSVTGITINNAGSGDAHNNVQPSIAIYVWKRDT